MKGPTSKFEKLLTGMQALEWLQPAARMEAEGSRVYLGDTEDPHVPKGLVDYLISLGFEVDENRKMFAFLVK